MSDFIQDRDMSDEIEVQLPEHCPWCKGDGGPCIHCAEGRVRALVSEGRADLVIRVAEVVSEACEQWRALPAGDGGKPVCGSGPWMGTHVAADRIIELVQRRFLCRLAAEINVINRANGWEVLRPEDWDDPRRIPTVISLIHSEVSEALEGFRNRDRANVAEELADVLIRVLDAAGGLGIDMDEEVRRKLAKNRTRGYKHGGKVV